MALLDYEHFNRETNPALSNWFNLGVSWFSISADNLGPYNYGRYVNSPGFSRTMPAAASVWWQAHLYFNTYTAQTLIEFWEAGVTKQGYFTLNSAGRILAYRGDNTLLAQSAPAVCSTLAWHFVQFRYVPATAGGAVELWIDGLQVFTFSGNTRNGGSGLIDNWTRSYTGSGVYYVANIVVYSESGAVPNARTPETRIFADLPTGAGASTGMTPSAGLNYQNVQEQPNNGDTNYNSTATAPVEDLFAYGSPVPAGSIVYAVAVEYVARKDDAGLNTTKGLLRSGVTTGAGTDLGLSTSYQRGRDIFTTDPNTAGAWAVAAANAAQAGVRRTA